MKLFSHFWAIAVMLILCSCHAARIDVPVTFYHSFPSDTVVTLRQVSMGETQVNPRCLLIGAGRVLVRTSTTQAIYAVYKYPAMTFVCNFGDQATYQVPLKQSHDDFFLMRGDSLFTYRFVAGDTLSQIAASYFHKGIFNRMLGLTKLNDKMYAYANSPSYAGLNEFFLVNVDKHEACPVGEYPESPVRFKSIQDFKSAYATEINAKPDGKRLLISYVRTRRFRIYSNEGDLLHDVLLDYPPFHRIVDTNAKRWLSQVSHSFTTDQSIYLLCADEETLNTHSSLLVMDWEGRPIARYRLDQPVNEFFIDEDTGLFCGINSNDSDHFYLFNLNQRCLL